MNAAILDFFFVLNDLTNTTDATSNVVILIMNQRWWHNEHTIFINDIAHILDIIVIFNQNSMQ